MPKPIASQGIYRGIDLDTMKFFDKISLNEVESLAAGLEPEEVCAYYGLTTAEVQESEQDWFYFTKAWNKGRTEAKRMAIRNLFHSMQGTKGKEASICYLKHFGNNDWKKAEETDGSDNNFKFEVILPSDTSY